MQVTLLNSVGDTAVTTRKFTGDERDGETRLDHTWFRQYSSQLGSWTAPDPARLPDGQAGLMAVSLEAPQSLNRYSYVNNMPLSYFDSLGLDYCSGNSSYTTGGGSTNGLPVDCGPSNPILTGTCPAQYQSCTTLSDGSVIAQTGSTTGFYFYTAPVEDSRNGIGYFYKPVTFYHVGDPLLGNIPPLSGGRVPMPSKISATPTLTFRPPSWSNFAHDFLPCYGAQLLYNFLGTDDQAAVTAGTVALMVTRPKLGGPLLALWAGINGPKAGAACAFASRAVYR